MKKVFYLLIILLSHQLLFSQNNKALENNIEVNSKLKPIENKDTLKIDTVITEIQPTVNASQTDTGILIIEKDENFDLLLQEYLEQKKVTGYRIQLFSGNKRIDALKVKVDFMKLYPEVIPEILYQQPNFKVRLGNYRNRLLANEAIQLYKIDFPGAFIIKDNIKLEAE